MSADPIPYTQFACIGTGFSAICLGATLSRWYNISSVRFFDRSNSLGGTWNVNRYPGAACDIPSALYSYSFAPNPSWTRLLPAGEELRRYLRDVATRYDLVDKMVFNTVVVKCEWIEERARWRLTTRNTVTGEVGLHECQFLYAGVGQFAQPRELDAPGVEKFKGEVMHSARWKEEVELDGKRVVVFGNGCTGTQIVPSIAGRVKHLTQIVRSRHWIMPPVDRRVPAGVRKVLEYIPGMLALQRFIIFWIAEGDFMAFSTANRRFRARMQQVAERYMRATAPEKYLGMLIPEWEYGCKRRVFDSGYLESLHRSNVTLTDEPAVEIVENGVRLRNGEVVEADVLVLANGFQMNDLLADVEVVGREGKTLKEHWRELGGVEAYNLTALNGYPNFFFPLGPNAATGHTSTVMTIENAINYSLRIIRPLLEGRAGVVEVRRDAEEAYVEEIHNELDKMVWATGGCNSWYRMESGANGKKRGWNGMTYPWWSGHYWYRCLFPRWSDWQYRGKSSKSTFVRRSTLGLLLRTSLFMMLSGVLAARWIKAHPGSALATTVNAIVSGPKISLATAKVVKWSGLQTLKWRE